MLLQLKQIQSFYGAVQVLRDFDLHVNRGEVVCLLGRNGAGKTTILRTIMGQVQHQGSILLEYEEIGNLPPHDIPRRGIGYVPQGRRLFAELTVAENLEIGFIATHKGRAVLDDIFDLFPVLRQRLDQISGTLSGGEQQMLAMARALCLEPRILLLDEPTEGLMPSMIAGIRQVVLKLRDQGVGILLVEQRVEAVLPVADRVVFIENGLLKTELSSQELQESPELLKRYIGV